MHHWWTQSEPPSGERLYFHKSSFTPKNRPLSPHKNGPSTAQGLQIDLYLIYFVAHVIHAQRCYLHSKPAALNVLNCRSYVHPYRQIKFRVCNLTQLGFRVRHGYKLALSYLFCWLMARTTQIWQRKACLVLCKNYAVKTLLHGNWKYQDVQKWVYLLYKFYTKMPRNVYIFCMNFAT